MKTIRISDGLIYTDPATGQWSLVEGPSKSSQDVARHLLTEYVVIFGEGNQVMNQVLGPGASQQMTEAMAVNFLSEAVNRLIVKQSSSVGTDRAIRINRLVTKTVGGSLLVFYLEVGLFDGGEASVSQFISMKPASLQHLLNADAISGV